MEQYQDIWVKGKLEKKGVRECEDRYKIIKKFLEQYKRPFTLLDMGANLGYFSFRIAEDFPDSSIVMIESPKLYGNQLQVLAVRNDKDNIMLLQSHLDIKRIQLLANVEHFDVVLGLSVVHHLEGDPNQMVNLLSTLGDHLIIELPNTPNACNPNKVEKLDIELFHGKVVKIGEGASHLTEEGKRPIYSISTMKNSIKQRYIGCPPHLKNVVTLDDSFSHKTYLHKNKNRRSRLWIHGINLYTFKIFNGTFPYDKTIESQIVLKFRSGMSDIRPWNFIISGRQVHYIDIDDPISKGNLDGDDLVKVIKWLNGDKVEFRNCSNSIDGSLRI